MTETDRDRLREIRTFPSLVKYLRDELDWPIDEIEIDDLMFEWEPDELGIDAKVAAKIKEIKQLRPLSSGQPWGIFFINFEPKRLPVVVLRRVLRSLVIKRRQSAQKAEQPAWHLHDLLFISSYGETDDRGISFANFSEGSQPSDLPTLRVLAWDDKDTVLHLGHAHETLKEKLRWPDDQSDHQAWQETWSSAFVLRPREVITTSKKLAMHMAALATQIRNRAKTILAVETESGPLRKLHKAFQEALIHDLSEDDFADMYAQTITYGFFAAACSRPAGLVADNLADMVPVTNPFLKELLSMFLEVAGRKGHIDFDELGVNDVVQLLLDADLEAVKRDFGDLRREEDPVIHFYELFLGEYDRKKKVQRGVFYTPQAVVSFIVRSVHEILQTEFGLEDGLADTTTWGEMAERNPELKLPTIKVRQPDSPDLVDEPIDPDTPFVQILDPACGTGTFLVEVIDLICNTMKAKWEKEGHLPLEFDKLWNEYVPKHLLPRLYGFELMMAPYTIAHMKIGLELDGTGYHFRCDERLRVYLTNSLEPPHDFSDTFEQMAPALAHEALAATHVKANLPITVTIGNPPYSGESANKIASIHDAVKTRYQQINGVKLKEKGKKNWLLDDYVKFLCLSHSIIIDGAGCGVLCMITNNAYKDNPTFRGLRRSWLDDFDSVRLLDLHGSSKRRDAQHEVGSDENVFDIVQGVGIALLVRLPHRPCGAIASVSRLECFGTRSSKYEFLSRKTAIAIRLENVNPCPPFWFFVIQDTTNLAEYNASPQLTEIFEVNGNGVITAKDHFAYGFSESDVRSRVAVFVDQRLSDEAVMKQLGVKGNSMWSVAKGRVRLRHELRDATYVSAAYRPFDTRCTLYHRDVVFNLRLPVMKHIVGGGNIALLVTRMTKGDSFRHVFVTRHVSDCALLSNQTSTNAFSFPLYQKSGDLFADASPERPNIVPFIISRLAKYFPLSWTERGRGDLSRTIGPEDMLHYIYTQLHSQAYRERYVEFLKTDFPRIFLTEDLDLFRSLSQLGADLVALHLLEDDYEAASWDAGAGPLTRPITRYVQDGRPEVAKAHPKYADGKVYINKVCYFDGVPEEVWNFYVGGYQVCRKWLKDRGPKKGNPGRVLTAEDIAHYQKIVVALKETIRLMKEIDEVIDTHGGWPDAFVTKGE